MSPRQHSCTRSEVGQDQPIRSVLNPDDLRLVLRLRVVLVQGLEPDDARPTDPHIQNINTRTREQAAGQRTGTGVGARNPVPGLVN